MTLGGNITNLPYKNKGLGALLAAAPGSGNNYVSQSYNQSKSQGYPYWKCRWVY
jgi:hypothetical protein